MQAIGGFVIEYLEGCDIARLMMAVQLDNIDSALRKILIERHGYLGADDIGKLFASTSLVDTGDLLIKQIHGEKVAIDGPMCLLQRLWRLDNIPDGSHTRFKKRGVANVLRGNNFDSIRRVFFTSRL